MEESAYLIFRMPSNAATLAGECHEIARLMAMGAGPGDRLICRPHHRFTIIKTLPLASMPLLIGASQFLEHVETGSALDPADVPLPLRRVVGLPDPPPCPPLRLVE